MIKTSMKRAYALPLLASSLILGGCLSSVLPDPAPADVVYRLSSLGSSAVPASGAIVVRIDRPAVPNVLLGQSIVVSPDGTRMATAGQARWVEPVPSLLQNSFFDTLSARENITGILPTAGARTTHRAHITVRNFEARFDQGETAPPLAVVHYTVTVSDAASRDLIGTHDVRKTERAGSPSVSAIVRAQDRANHAAMEDIADWLETLPR